jgi:hypothetical protein
MYPSGNQVAPTACDVKEEKQFSVPGAALNENCAELFGRLKEECDWKWGRNGRNGEMEKCGRV